MKSSIFGSPYAPYGLSTGRLNAAQPNLQTFRIDSKPSAFGGSMLPIYKINVVPVNCDTEVLLFTQHEGIIVVQVLEKRRRLAAGKSRSLHEFYVEIKDTMQAPKQVTSLGSLAAGMRKWLRCNPGAEGRSPAVGHGWKLVGAGEYYTYKLEMDKLEDAVNQAKKRNLLDAINKTTFQALALNRSQRSIYNSFFAPYLTGRHITVKKK